MVEVLIGHYSNILVSRTYILRLAVGRVGGVGIIIVWTLGLEIVVISVGKTIILGPFVLH